MISHVPRVVLPSGAKSLAQGSESLARIYLPIWHAYSSASVTPPEGPAAESSHQTNRVPRQRSQPGPSTSPSPVEAGGTTPGSAGVDLALQNAPSKYLQLIGDPRTGIADDTLRNPFGELQSELIWLQESNLTQWYKYRYTTDRKEGHRDGRLSEYSKNLLYILRAKDPQRWTIAELAKKFRIRRQRVLAILTHKELEGQAIEDGVMMGGPMRALACPVPLAEVPLDPVSGELRDFDRDASRPTAGPSLSTEKTASAKPPTPVDSFFGSLDAYTTSDPPVDTPTSDPPVDTPTSTASPSSSPVLLYRGDRDLRVLLPQLVTTAQQLQLQLIEALSGCAYNHQTWKDEVLLELDKAKAYWDQHFAVATSGDKEGPNEEAPSPTSDAGSTPGVSSFQQYRSQILELVDSLRPLFRSKYLDDQRSATELLELMKEVLDQRGQQQRPPVKVEEAQAAVAEEDEAAAQEPSVEVEPLLSTSPDSELEEGTNKEPEADGSSASALDKLQARVHEISAEVLETALGELLPEQRQVLLGLAPELRALRNIVGTNLVGADEGRGKDDTDSALHGTLIDVYGFEDVLKGRAADRIIRAMEGVERAFERVKESVGAAGTPAEGDVEAVDSALGPLLSNDLKALVELLRTYQQVNRLMSSIAEADRMDTRVAELQGVGPKEADRARDRHFEEDAARQEGLVKVLCEIDPHALEKLEAWELFHKAAEEKLSTVQPGTLSEKQAMRDLKRRKKELIALLRERYPAPRQVPDRLRKGHINMHHHYSPEAMAAYLDYVVGQKIYWRGSGERHRVKLPTFPTFEGLTLAEFDKLDEGEVSKATRLASLRQDELMFREFHESLLHNLGLAGTDLHIGMKHALPEKPREGWHYVVRDLGRQKVTVALPDGTSRPLTESETYFQHLRKGKRRRRYTFLNRS